MDSKGQSKNSDMRHIGAANSDFVFEKTIFSNIFDKDIRRVYIYKKAERLARAIHLITPAFGHSASLRERAERVAIALIDGAVLPPAESREALSRELLSLGSLLSLARTGGHLSPMNAELIAREAENLLHEVAGYEEPRLPLGDLPTLAELAKSSREGARGGAESPRLSPGAQAAALRPKQIVSHKGQNAEHVKDSETKASRRDHILSVLKGRDNADIKAISTTIRGVSEKTIQRELQSLVEEGAITRAGKRRWTTYSLAK